MVSFVFSFESWFKANHCAKSLHGSPPVKSVILHIDFIRDNKIKVLMFTF